MNVCVSTIKLLNMLGRDHDKKVKDWKEELLQRQEVEVYVCMFYNIAIVIYIIIQNYNTKASLNVVNLSRANDISLSEHLESLQHCGSAISNKDVLDIDDADSVDGDEVVHLGSLTPGSGSITSATGFKSIN